MQGGFLFSSLSSLTALKWFKNCSNVSGALHMVVKNDFLIFLNEINVIFFLYLYF